MLFIPVEDADAWDIVRLYPAEMDRLLKEGAVIPDPVEFREPNAS